MEQRVLLEGCQKKKHELSRDLDCQPEGLDFILKVRGVRMGRTWREREEGASALWGPVVTTQTSEIGFACV